MRCPVPRVSASSRTLQQRIETPSGFDPLCLHAVWTKEKKSLTELARDGVVLAPLTDRPHTTSTMIFTEDYLAGDADYIFFSVNYPAPQFGGDNLCFDVEALADLGPIGFRPFDLIRLYRELFEGRLWGEKIPGVEDYLDRVEARIGSRIYSDETRIGIDKDPATDGFRRFLRGFANCFTIWGEAEVKGAIAFWADLSGTSPRYEDFLLQDIFMEELLDQRWFKPTLEHIKAYTSDWGNFVSEERIWWTYYNQARFFASIEGHVGELLVKGKVPVCCARGYAKWQLARDRPVYEPVPDSLVVFGEDVCLDGLAMVNL